MKRWQIILVAYLVSVPIPFFVMKALGLVIYKEQAIWWFAMLYMSPMGLVGEALGARSLSTAALIYWALAISCIAGWIYFRRRAHMADL
jgi:hypothetical protein